MINNRKTAACKFAEDGRKTGFMKKDRLKIILAAAVLLVCGTLTGCGCGKKEKDPASEQVLKISITPEPSPTPAPETVDPSAVETNGEITMVNTYLVDHPSAAGQEQESEPADTEDEEE